MALRAFITLAAEVKETKIVIGTTNNYLFMIDNFTGMTVSKTFCQQQQQQLGLNIFVVENLAHDLLDFMCICRFCQVHLYKLCSSYPTF